jgi:hypothetical protein
MIKPYGPAYLSEILEAELAAVVAHHTEMANLERECARLAKRGHLRLASYDEAEESDDRRWYDGNPADRSAGFLGAQSKLGFR